MPVKNNKKRRVKPRKLTFASLLRIIGIALASAVLVAGLVACVILYYRYITK